MLQLLPLLHLNGVAWGAIPFSPIQRSLLQLLPLLQSLGERDAGGRVGDWVGHLHEGRGMGFTRAWGGGPLTKR